MTMEQAIDWIIKQISEKDKEYILNEIALGKSVKDISIESHHGFGTAVRNGLLLWKSEPSDLKKEIWNSLTPEKQRYYSDWWRKSGNSYIESMMHADDASAVLIEAALTRLATPPSKKASLSNHLSHCNFGENVNSCKYGEDDCPSLTDEWAWFGNIIQESDRLRDQIQVLEEKIQACEKDRDIFRALAEELRAGKTVSKLLGLDQNRRMPDHEFDSDGFCLYCAQWKYDFALLPGMCIATER
jgi:hypothetical protein